VCVSLHSKATVIILKYNTIITCYLSDREQYVVSGNLCVQVLIYRGSKGKDIEFQSDARFCHKSKELAVFK